MKLLLDTHAFLWWIADDSRLSSRASELIAEPDNEVWVSAASGWEIAVKTALGRLEIPDPPSFVPHHIEMNGFLGLAVAMRHALLVGGLAAQHRDPFDTMLVAQAHAEDMTLVTGDRALQALPVRWEW